MRYKPLKTQKDHEEATKSIEGFKAIAKEISPQAKEITAEELREIAEQKIFAKGTIGYHNMDLAEMVAKDIAEAILSKYRVVER